MYFFYRQHFVLLARKKRTNGIVTHTHITSLSLKLDRRIMSYIYTWFEEVSVVTALTQPCKYSMDFCNCNPPCPCHPASLDKVKYISLNKNRFKNCTRNNKTNVFLLYCNYSFTIYYFWTRIVIFRLQYSKRKLKTFFKVYVGAHRKSRTKVNTNWSTNF